MARLARITPQIETDWTQCLRDFLLVKAAQGLAERTLRDYEYHVTAFFQKRNAVTGSVTAVTDYVTLERNVLEHFASASHLAPDTLNIRRKNLNTFFNWCVREGIIHANPMRHIKKRKSEGRIRPVDPDDLKRLLSLPDRKMFVGLRDYVLMALSLDTGIRPSEALSLVAPDVNTKSREVYVRPEVAKTGVSRALPISTEVATSLARLLSVTQAAWDTKQVFCTCTGRRMTMNAWKH